MSGESVASAFDVTITSPALTVAPAAMVSILPVPTLKSPAAAFVPGAADTMIVMASPDVPPLRPAVTVAAPPFSGIEVGVSVSVAVGRSSSSTIVSDAAVTPTAPRSFAAVPVTVTVLSDESRASSFAMIVTVPVLLTCPAAMVRVVPVCVKSPATATLPGAADTVIVTAELDECESVAATVATPPFSETDDGDRESVTDGAASSSSSVNVRGRGFATPWPPMATPDTATCLFG